MQIQTIVDEHTTFIQSTAQTINSINKHNMALFNQTQEQFDLVKTTLAKVREDYEHIWANMEL